MKKLFAVIFALSMTLGSINIYAQEPLSNDSDSLTTTIEQADENYFEFIGNHGERMDKSGGFTFEISSSVLSDHFTLNKTSTTITIGAEKFNTNIARPKATLELYEDGIINKKIGSLAFYADKQDYSKNFTNLKIGQEYYFRIKYNDGDGFISGGGMVSNVDKVY